MSVFEPNLEVLPPAQRSLWPKLAFTRSKFILYGGTALALRLGHRVSVDFDFFSFESFQPATLLQSVPLLSESDVLQLEANTLTVALPQAAGPVKLSLFGGLTFKQARPPEITSDGVLRVASLHDLFATKLNVVYQRAEARDYLDIHALLGSGLSLAEGLDSARQVYGDHFNAMLPLQALCYFEESGLTALPEHVKCTLADAVHSVR